jgi:hypothetical protein
MREVADAQHRIEVRWGLHEDETPDSRAFGAEWCAQPGGQESFHRC